MGVRRPLVAAVAGDDLADGLEQGLQLVGGAGPGQVQTETSGQFPGRSRVELGATLEKYD